MTESGQRVGRQRKFVNAGRVEQASHVLRNSLVVALFGGRFPVIDRSTVFRKHDLNQRQIVEHRDIGWIAFQTGLVMLQSLVELASANRVGWLRQ